ncbi:Maf family protein, partial [Klebsiella pneumoniae]|uniref:Maf family protein n=1 Tax=Klebsiella pneumoniae TaxID=573 RepID=UPI003F87A63D
MPVRDECRRAAREKAQAGVAMATRDLPVLGADTIVILNGEVLEKPRDAELAQSSAAQAGRLFTPPPD